MSESNASGKGGNTRFVQARKEILNFIFGYAYAGIVKQQLHGIIQLGKIVRVGEFYSTIKKVEYS